MDEDGLASSEKVRELTVVSKGWRMPAQSCFGFGDYLWHKASILIGTKSFKKAP
jgi:hypothetical protein